MAQPNISTHYLNSHVEAFPCWMSNDEGKGLCDLLSLYSPNNVLRKVVTYFGHGGAMPIHVGHSEYYDFDYVARRLTGLSSLNTGLNTSLFAGGKGYDVPHMFLSSLSEAVERVLGSMALFEHVEKFVYASYRTMVKDGYTCLGPADIPLFAEEQYQSNDLFYERFTEDSLVGWIHVEARGPANGSASIRIVHANGRVVRERRYFGLAPGQYQTFTMDTSGLPSGVYFLWYQSSNEKGVGRKIILLK